MKITVQFTRFFPKKKRSPLIIVYQQQVLCITGFQRHILKCQPTSLLNQIEKKYPKSLNTNCQAGEQWLVEFRKRNPELFLRTPRPTCIGRATRFNKPVVKLFFTRIQDYQQNTSSLLTGFLMWMRHGFLFTLRLKSQLPKN